MTSDKQIEANRRNAQKSTGPATDEGKARSRMNALDHGGYLRQADFVTATLLQEEPDEIEAVYRALIDDLEPATWLEMNQAAAIAQQIINQQRIHGLTAAIASWAEIEPDVDKWIGPTRREHTFWENLTWAIGTREDEAEPMIPYAYLATELHRRGFDGLDPLPEPVVDEIGDCDIDSEAWRRELLKLVEYRFGPATTAMPKISAARDYLASLADRETRTERGIEAKRMIASFDKTIALHDRLSRLIARDLKAYRQLKAPQAGSEN